MSEADPDESFVFVDKRKVNAELAAEPETEPEAEQPAAEFGSVDDQIELEPEDDVLAGAFGSGSYGLVAYVVGLIASDAWQKLGLIADPSTGKAAKDLKQARFSIDCVAALIGVIEQSGVELPDSLRHDLRRVLADLRMNFVEQSGRSPS